MPAARWESSNGPAPEPAMRERYGLRTSPPRATGEGDRLERIARLRRSPRVFVQRTQ
jgi:hypothetical protein